MYGYGERGAGALGSLRSPGLGIFPGASSDGPRGALPLRAYLSSTTWLSWAACAALPASCSGLQKLVGQGEAESHWVRFTPQGHRVKNPGEKVNLSQPKMFCGFFFFFPFFPPCFLVFQNLSPQNLRVPQGGGGLLLVYMQQSVPKHAQNICHWWK